MNVSVLSRLKKDMKFGGEMEAGIQEDLDGTACTKHKTVHCMYI